MGFVLTFKSLWARFVGLLVVMVFSLLPASSGLGADVHTTWLAGVACWLPDKAIQA